MLWTANGVGVTIQASVKALPDIASDDASGAVVVWKDWRTYPNDVALFAQRLNATGQAQWSADGNLIAYSQRPWAIDPAIISDGNGETIVAFDTGEWDGALLDIVPYLRVQRLDANGAPEWAQPGVALRGYTGFPGDGGVDRIALVSDGWGGAIVAWQDHAYWQASDVRVGHVSPSGTTTDVTPTRGPSLMAVDVYPNPFSGAAKIAIELTTPSRVDIDVFDVAGRRVRSLTRNAGSLSQVVELSDRDDAGQRLSSGVYFCRVRSTQGTMTRKIVITR